MDCYIPDRSNSDDKCVSVYVYKCMCTICICAGVCVCVCVCVTVHVHEQACSQDFQKGLFSMHGCMSKVYVCMNNQRTTSPLTIGLDVIQSHPLCRTRFRLASFPGPRPASHRLQYGKARPASRRLQYGKARFTVLQATGSWAGAWE